MDYTFNGQLEWGIIPQSMATDIDMEAIQREILDTRPEWTDKERSVVSEIAILLSCTRSAKITGDKHPESVVEVVNGINNRLPASELFDWRLRMPHSMVAAWNAAWLGGQDFFAVDPAQIPTNMLSQSQQEELKDKNSPLVGVG